MSSERRTTRGRRFPLLALAATVAATACGPSEARAPESEEEFARTVNVEVLRLAPSSFTDQMRITGTVEAIEDVTVSAEETGRVRRIQAEKGATVARGAALLALEEDMLRAQVREAEATALLARDRYDRQAMLWEDGIGTESAYVQARYEADAAEARLETLRSRLERTVIRAPITGVLDGRFVELGEMVRAGEPVARIVRVDRLKVVGGVPERFAGEVSRGDSVRVVLDLFPGRSFPGVLSFVGARVDEDSRTFPVEVIMDRPGEGAKPKMLANVEIDTRRLEDVIVVPQEVVFRADDGYRVLVAVEREGRVLAESRLVRLGPSRQNRTVVEEGLDPGDLLVIRGQQSADPGDRLRIVATHRGGER